jgi:acyl-CoA synthetase (AMP-forming)/AMP-acid ligase II
MPDILRDLLANGADEAPAISAPGRPALTFGALRALIGDTLTQLNTLGIGRNDRVAIVLANGPEMATCFMACASGVTSAPLNPAYRADEFEFYLTDLNARALIVEQGSTSPAIDVAGRLGVRVIELIASPDQPAGHFVLQARGGATTSAPTVAGGFAQPGDVSMVLHTSGTTSRPKIVPLSQANLVASATNIRNSLQFTAQDCGLNVMPLFHIHGLIAGVLAPLAAGSQVFCTPGFNALKFFSWMDEAKPSWYTAVPTMHQAIVSRARGNADIIARNPLRFLRSSSSSMPPQVIKELEDIFHAPLIEAYGMTEATHQMACNPLPPAVRKPGKVGIAAGPEVAIMGQDGALLPRGDTGEIVIRGANVTAGYENNPQANEEGFLNGWFRTGDQGVMDEDDYISITGRLKEIINRGGEKVSPREVDEILMDHAAVAQVVCFGMPHPKLGEEVAAVVVLREGHTATERELQAYVSSRAADYKVPKKILFMDEIPKGATGKLQRIGLAAKLGLG